MAQSHYCYNVATDCTFMFVLKPPALLKLNLSFKVNKEQGSKVMQDTELVHGIQEWLDSLDSMVEFEGVEAGEQLMKQLLAKATELGLNNASSINTPYSNTINPQDQRALPDDGKVASRLMAYLRWNAIAMVMKAGRTKPELGGHLASYASSAHLFETGLNHFFGLDTVISLAT